MKAVTIPSEANKPNDTAILDQYNDQMIDSVDNDAYLLCLLNEDGDAITEIIEYTTRTELAEAAGQFACRQRCYVPNTQDAVELKKMLLSRPDGEKDETIPLSH